MEKENINDLITAHIGWAKGKANYFSKCYHIDFDDAFSYALESIWNAASYETEEGCDRNLRWFAAIFMKRRIVDMIRKANASRRKIPFEYVDFDRVQAASVTFLTADNGPFEPREPCIECGTTGGLPFRGRNYTARCRGYCLSCYDKIYQRKKRQRKATA